MKFRIGSPVVLAAAFLLAIGAARADSGHCSGSASNVVFGTLGLTSLQNATAVGQVSTSCPGGVTATKTWDFCASIGVGANSMSQSERQMTFGSNAIAYQLYTDPSYSTPFQYPGGNLTASTYNGSTGVVVPFNVYAKILSTGATLPPGTYTDSYTGGAQAAIANDSNPTGVASAECTGESGPNAWNATPFTVSVTLSASCSVTATPLNFGTIGPLASPVNATTNLSVACTYSTPYTVSLSPGNGPNATTSARAMTNGGSQLDYALYQDSAMTRNWGDNAGADTVGGTGTGAAQSFPVYGQIPAQTTPPPGVYGDTIVVTLNY